MDPPFGATAPSRARPIRARRLSSSLFPTGQETIHVIDKIKTRMASEQGFTLIELLVVIVIIGILVAIAVPSYLSFRSKAQTAAAESNVRTAVPAAESFYNGPGAQTYTGLNFAALNTEAPGIA